MTVSAVSNPNVCSRCAELAWDEASEIAALGPDASVGEPSADAGYSQNPSELERLLELDSPSVMECFNAVEQAKEAMAEAAAQESANPAPASKLKATPSGLPPA